METWFKLKVIHGADVVVIDNNDDEELSDDEICEAENQNPLELAISKTTHTRFMKIAFNSAGLLLQKWVDLAGVPESQIRRMGQWNTDTMTHAYLDTLFLVSSCRVMAGFENDASYHLPRGIEEPWYFPLGRLLARSSCQ
ncbi:hypothetical protein INT45_001303 [Circinella minor]|uniref:Uncharacterized protein n=1 Tax=Circinella minor TaxID=1195481 RepID=A0A8H7S7E8_9FUNG|nr:hypothetical protein INT45_001303 [Circinella minor]